MSPAELVEFLFNMQDKPRSIQRRAGFAEALVEAADRILAAETSDKFRRLATVAKLETLHQQAVDGNAAADESLGQFVAQLQETAGDKLAPAVAFYALERRVLQADALELERLPGLLAEVHEWMQGRKLGTPHLRLASETVGTINRLQDLEQREKYFQQFGEVFSKSRDKQLAAYGRRVAGAKPSRTLDLIGKPLQLAGPTDFGTALDWDGYRGRVVLVDFWATWCPACQRETPRIDALHKRLAGRGLEVVGVSIDNDLEALAKYLEDHRVSWPNLIGEEARQAAQRLGIAAVPTLLVIDRQGQVAAVGHRVADLEEEIVKLLGS